MRTVRSLVAVAALTVVGGLLAAVPAQAAPGAIVISQVYGGGGNSGATLKQDFVELFNRSAAAVDISGWTVQYGSATAAAGTFSGTTTIPAGQSIASGRYYLVGEGSGTGGTADLPPTDVTGTINMSGTAGKVKLVNGTTTVDLVGYGTPADFETAPTPALSNTTADLRKANGCTDADNNASDFDVVAQPLNPRNSAATAAPCGAPPADSAPTVASTSPANSALGVPVGSNITVTFSEPVDATASAFTVSCASSGAHTVVTSGGPTTFTLGPDTDFSASEVCTLTVAAAQVSDQDTDDPPDTMVADFTSHFTTAGPAVAIHDVQGAAHISPMAGQVVTLMPGIVTAKRTNGYYLQDPVPDTDDATSEAIFVFTNSAPTVSVGDEVSVSGTVTEFRGGGATSPGLTSTEINGPTTTLISGGQPLPAATVIGAGGRVPPTEIIENDSTDVETNGVFDPAEDGIDFYESLEDMRVQINNAVASGPSNSFGETSVLADNGANATGRTPRGGVVVSADDFNPERIIVSDAITPVPAVNVGDHFSGPIVGAMDYAFDNPMVFVTDAVTAIHDGVSRETTSPPGAGELAVATFNVENLDPTDPQEKFDRLASIIVTNMQSPDLMSVEEVQDSNGAKDDGTVDSDVTSDKLIAAITAAGGPAYTFKHINPVNDQDGGEPGGNIRVGFLFRTDRGLAFVDRPGGDSTTPVTVLAGPQLSASPGRIDPTNSAFDNSRKPLAAEFTFNGAPLFVIGNHFNSKGGDEPLYGHRQPPVRSSEVQRHQQAQIVHDFVDGIFAQDANANVIVLGDLNDFEFSQTVTTLSGTTLHDLLLTLPKEERYSYVFEGNSQSLDHILVSSHLLSTLANYDVVHVNAEFADQASDHDPMVARLKPAAANSKPTVDGGGPYTVPEGGIATLTATGADADGDPLTYAWDLDNNGTFETAGQSVPFSAGGLDGPTSATVKVQVTDPSGDTGQDTATVNVTNVAPQITSTTAGVNAGCGAGSALTVKFTDPSADTFAATVNWGGGVVEQFPSVTSPFSPTHTYPKAGRHVVSVTITDDDGGVSAPDADVVSVDYRVVGNGVQQPLNSTGPISVFKSGTIIAVKVQLQDCDGTFPTTLAPTLAAALGSHNTPGAVNEAVAKPTANVGPTMHFVSASKLYVYNFPTTRLADQTATYHFTISVPSTGQKVVVRFGVRT